MTDPVDQQRITQTIVVQCAHGHPPILFSSRRDQPVPCPVCERIAQTPPQTPPQEATR